MVVDPESPNEPPLDLSLLKGVQADSASCGAVATDFGNSLHRTPQGVLRPRSIEDVAAAFRYCGSRNIEIAMRGQGHSTNGQALTTGLVIDSSTLNRVHSITREQVVVGAGARWRDVLRETLPFGLTPPVLTDYLGLSVGGTLSVGGLGGTSFRYGSLADCVLAAETIVPSGEIIHCSPTKNSDLFDLVLCGLGQCAFIERVTLSLVAAPTNVRRFKFFYRHLHDLLADQSRLLNESRFDYLEGQIFWDAASGWGYVIEAGKFLNSLESADDEKLVSALRCDPAATEITELTYLDFLERLEPSLARFKLSGEWEHPHPWLNVLLPASGAPAFIQDALSASRPEDVGPSGVILVYPLTKKRFRRPMMRVPEEDVFFLFALLRTVPPNGESIHRATSDNRDIFLKAQSIGGTVYPVGTVELTVEDWQTQLGGQWDVLRAAKKRYDPRGILADGHHIFRSKKSAS